MDQKRETIVVCPHNLKQTILHGTIKGKARRGRRQFRQDWDELY